MFTGIITDIGRVEEIIGEQEKTFTISSKYKKLQLGESIACDGVCMTVIDYQARCFQVTASATSLACTSLGGWRQGQAVNLERSLCLGERMGGHIVFGHVDGMVTITAITPLYQSYELTVAVDSSLIPFLVSKGSMSLDGISLTVQNIVNNSVTTTIIPHTWHYTHLHTKHEGDLCNLEIDMLARYVARQLEYRVNNKVKYGK